MEERRQPPRLPARVPEFAGSLIAEFVLRIRSLRVGTEFKIWNGGVGSLDNCAWWRAETSSLAESMDRKGRA